MGEGTSGGEWSGARGRRVYVCEYSTETIRCKIQEKSKSKRALQACAEIIPCKDRRYRDRYKERGGEGRDRAENQASQSKAMSRMSAGDCLIDALVMARASEMEDAAFGVMKNSSLLANHSLASTTWARLSDTEANRAPTVTLWSGAQSHLSAPSIKTPVRAGGRHREHRRASADINSTPTAIGVQGQFALRGG
ncbi:hypothetical protein B0H12DRAFT_1080052 [Mycena haematopus]|nr:hypothetical protein B0H12DRAFT_1080052 [Mycena haematopus]